MTRRSARALRLLAIPLALTFIGIVPSLWSSRSSSGVRCAALVAHARLAQDRPRRAPHPVLPSDRGGRRRGDLRRADRARGLHDRARISDRVRAGASLVPAAAIVGHRVPSWVARAGLAVSLGVVAIAVVAIRSDGTQRSLTIAMVVAACGLMAAFVRTTRPIGFAAAVGVILLAFEIFPANPTLFVDRTFYGVHRVYVDANGASHPSERYDRARDPERGRWKAERHARRLLQRRRSTRRCRGRCVARLASDRGDRRGRRRSPHICAPVTR